MRAFTSRRRTEEGSVIENSWLGGFTYSTPGADTNRNHPCKKVSTVLNCHTTGCQVQSIWRTLTAVRLRSLGLGKQGGPSRKGKSGSDYRGPPTESGSATNSAGIGSDAAFKFSRTRNHLVLGAK